MATIFVTGYVFDTVNQEYVRPKFLFNGTVIQAPLGEVFARVDVEPGSYTIEMITEGYTFDYWGAWEEDPYWPVFEDRYANPTIISTLDNSYFYCMVHLTPDPMETVFVENYRGVDIFQYLVSGWYTFTYAGITYSLPLTLAEIRAAIDDAMMAADEPELIETYRDVDIYWLPLQFIFWAFIEAGVYAIGDTLQDVKNQIDEFLDFIEDPPLDPGSIFEQLMTWIMNWITVSLPNWLAPVYGAIDAALAGANAAWTATFGALASVVDDLKAGLTSLGTELRGRWDTFTTLTLPSIWATITSNAADAMAAIDLKGTEMEASMDTKLVDFAVWVRDFVKLSDPYAFLKDPMGFITTAFNTLIAPFGEDVVRSFWEGFEEGQADG